MCTHAINSLIGGFVYVLNTFLPIHPLENLSVALCYEVTFCSDIYNMVVLFSKTSSMMVFNI